MTTKTASSLKLKASVELYSPAKGKSELRDAARNNAVIYTGTYRQCVAEAKRRGVWFS